ncbi:hypothetical protein K502DRAFT_346138 [Neoconidiobolus thromboides FSU 785]|nr:hypothetical protein K502DRAFT_346138 [Neoconidiobolus thromboides FSU 785]
MFFRKDYSKKNSRLRHDNSEKHKVNVARYLKDVEITSKTKKEEQRKVDLELKRIEKIVGSNFTNTSITKPSSSATNTSSAITIQKPTASTPTIKKKAVQEVPLIAPKVPLPQPSLTEQYETIKKDKIILEGKIGKWEIVTENKMETIEDEKELKDGEDKEDGIKDPEDLREFQFETKKEIGEVELPEFLKKDAIKLEEGGEVEGITNGFKKRKMGNRNLRKKEE